VRFLHHGNNDPIHSCATAGTDHPRQWENLHCSPKCRGKLIAGGSSTQRLLIYASCTQIKINAPIIVVSILDFVSCLLFVSCHLCSPHRSRRILIYTLRSLDRSYPRSWRLSSERYTPYIVSIGSQRLIYFTSWILAYPGVVNHLPTCVDVAQPSAVNSYRPPAAIHTGVEACSKYWIKM
jgi:hypothetical protein